MFVTPVDSLSISISVGSVSICPFEVPGAFCLTSQGGILVRFSSRPSLSGPSTEKWAEEKVNTRFPGCRGEIAGGKETVDPRDWALLHTIDAR